MNPNLPDLSTLAQWPTLIVLGICSFAGLALKGIPVQSFRNWLIPYCVGGIGGIVGWCLMGQDLNALLLGILLGGISVYGHQLVTQFLNRQMPPAAGLLLALALGTALVGCSTPQPQPVLAPEVQSDLAKVQAQVAQAGQAFAAWISQPANQKLVTAVATAGAKLALVGEALAGVDAQTVASHRAEMWAWGNTFYSLQGGSATVDQVNGALAATSPDLAGAASSYAQAFDLWNGLVASGVTALQGFPDALRILLGCFAQAAMNAAGLNLQVPDMWAWLKTLFGVGVNTAASAPLGGIPGAVSAGAEAAHAVVDGVREGNRNATERAIAKEQSENNAAIDAAIKRATQTGSSLALAGLLALFPSGCASAPSRDTALSSGNVGRLLARPDFDPAAKAAPEWTGDALKTVNSLEADLQRERARANQVK